MLLTIALAAAVALVVRTHRLEERVRLEVEERTRAEHHLLQRDASLFRVYLPDHPEELEVAVRPDPVAATGEGSARP